MSGNTSCIKDFVPQRDLYLSLNRFLKSKFGEKVKKIPVDAGFTCPNRDGTKGKRGCIYCDSYGSGTGMGLKGLSVEEQIKLFLPRFKEKGYKKFILYFQSFSNTYGPPEKLRETYRVVERFPEIIGIAIGTRPDCIDHDGLEVLKEFREKGYYLWVELGVQSIFNETLERINRGHTFEDFLRAYELLKKEGFPVVVHIIFGLPGETREMMLETAKRMGELKVDGIKFHALYIIKGSEMERLYKEGKYRPIEFETYVRLVADSLCYLPSSTVIHRLCSEASRERILAPFWVSEKMKVINEIRRYMKEKGLYQGKYLESKERRQKGDG